MREGITIDVACPYFGTAGWEFILADTLGHLQYTRNMVTGASTAESESCLSTRAIPRSGLPAVNVVDQSANTPWYDGPTLRRKTACRRGSLTALLPFPVQCVIRPRRPDYPDGRGTPRRG